MSFEMSLCLKSYLIDRTFKLKLVHALQVLLAVIQVVACVIALLTLYRLLNAVEALLYETSEHFYSCTHICSGMHRTLMVYSLQLFHFYLQSEYPIIDFILIFVTNGHVILQAGFVTVIFVAPETFVLRLLPDALFRGNSLWVNLRDLEK